MVKCSLQEHIALTFVWMNSPWHIRILFLLILIMVSSLLGWSGYQMALLERKATGEQVEQIIRNIALKFQYGNFTDRNLAGLYGKKDAAERIAFAAGITQNKGKIGVFFDAGTGNKPKPSVNDKPVLNMKQIAARRSFTPALVYTIARYENKLTDSLKKIKIGMNYALHQEKEFDTLAHKYASSSPPFIINVLDPTVYHIDYEISTATIFRKMLPYLFICLFILLLLCGAFIFYVRSYRVQMQMVQFREALFSNITHELKTPLSSLQLILDNAAANTTGDQLMLSKEHLGFAGSELKRMQLLVDKVLSFGKMNPDQFELNKTYVHLDEIIRESITIMQLNSTGDVISYQLLKDKVIPGDRMLLVNMLSTLLDNALKYSSGKPEVLIQLDASDTAAIIRIKDNGIGIPAVYHKKIFEPFFRVPTGNVHKVKGHGLGLSLVAQVVQLHNGKIIVESIPGLETTFTITIPSGNA